MESYEHREPWNKGKLDGRKDPLKPEGIGATRIHPQTELEGRDLALFDLVIDTTLRGCDLVSLHVREVTHPSQNDRATLSPAGGPVRSGLRFGDYWRLGLPLEVIVVTVSIPMLLWARPLCGARPKVVPSSRLEARADALQ